MFELDCESAEKALASVCDGYNCSAAVLEDVLLSIDLEKYIRENWLSIESESQDYLYQYVNKALGEPDSLQSVMWFHATRTIPSNNYSDGIKPLRKILPKLWEMLVEHAPDDETRKRVLEIIEFNKFGDLFRHKMDVDTEEGPFGVLIKEIVFNTDSLNHGDYLGMPEIFEDAFGATITQRYKDILIPKIVKVRRQSEGSRGEIYHALCYLYTTVRGKLPDQSCVYCFDAGNQTIQPQDIVSVQNV